MTTVEINGRPYAVTDCTTCPGDGKKADPTCADAITPGPYADKCPECAGRGRVYRNLATEAKAAADREELETRLAAQEIGEMPSWMM